MPSSSACRASPSGPVFAEAAGEHHERANTFELAFPRGLHHKRRGDGDDGQFHGSGDVCDGCVGSPAGDGLRVRVDRIDRPAERAGHEIADDRPADAHPPARGADHRDRRRLEDVAHCGHGADPVALLEVVDRLLSQLGRQLDLEHARLGTHLDGEARVAEHPKHPAVGRMHPRHERHDATRLGELSEVCQQQGGDALTLPGVRNRDGELGAIARLRDEDRVRDDRLLRAGDGHQAGAALDECPRHVVHWRTRPEEAEPPRLRRQAAKEGGDAVHVSGAGRAQADGGAVTQDDVAVVDGRG